jgi:hypothetical protein
MHRILLARRGRDKALSKACELHAVWSIRQRGEPLQSHAKDVIHRKLGRVSHLARHWLGECFEAFPIPIEDVIWVERAGQTVATDGKVIRRLARPSSR